jgi:hypothetical protein
MAGRIVREAAVTRKKGHLYFIDKQGNVRETKMNRRGGKPGRSVPRKNKCTKTAKASKKK